MKTFSKSGTKRSEAGVALLIAIFVLMLVSVVAISLIVSSGTETALDGNYRSSGNAYYAALAGLEEARGRLLPKNPSYLNITNPNCVPAFGATMPIGTACYITNPVAGENVLASYPDKEYGTEFSGANPTTTVTAASVSSTNVQGLPGPLYKWVRINAATEQSIGLNVDNRALPLDSTTPLLYDGSHLNLTTGNQALEITALAALPNGSTKLLQYVVAPVSLGSAMNVPGNLALPAALTLLGSTGKDAFFQGPANPQFFVSGNDSFPVGSCTPSATAINAIGYSGGDNSQITAAPAGNFPGAGVPPGTPSVQPVTLPASFQTPAALDAAVQTIAQGADAVITKPPGQDATQYDLPAGMSATNPMTIVVNGNLNVAAWHNSSNPGYGILVITGTFEYDPDATWNGIVLVIGQGTFVSTKAGYGQINGSMLIAKTRDSSGNLLSNFGAASFSQTGGAPAGDGIYYSSCLNNLVQTPLKYRVLSFREVPLS